MHKPLPTRIELKSKSGYLALSYPDAPNETLLSFEFLRVMSPSAEVRGHGHGNEKLQWGKKDVRITQVEPVGNYGIKLVFSDGHDSGIYSWDLLHRYCKEHDTLWQHYLDQLQAAGKSRA